MHKDIQRWFSRQFQKLKIALDPDYSAQARGNQQDQPRITLTDAAHDEEAAQRREQQAATAARVFVNHPHPLRSNVPQVKRKPLPSHRKPLATTPSLATSPALSCRNDRFESNTDKELPDFLKPGPTDELVLQHDLKPPVPRNKQREDPDHAPRSWRDSYQQQSNAGKPRTLLPYTAYSGDFTNACRHTTFGAPEASSSSKRPATANTTASNDPDIPMNQVAGDARFKKHYGSIENCDTPYMNNLASMIPNPRPLSPKVPLAPSKCHRNFDEDSLPYRNYTSKNGPSSNQCAASYQDVCRGRVQHPPPNRPPPPPPPPPSPPAMQSPPAHHTATTPTDKPLPFPPTPTNPHILYSREEWLAMPMRKRFWIKFLYYWHDYLDEKPQPWQDG